MQIVVLTIPHGQQRYNTVGDWWFDADELVLQIRVSQLGDWRYEMAIAQHEQYEALLCYARGINEKEVTDFDMKFEKNKSLDDSDHIKEPGDHPEAPYYAEHAKALVIEHMFLADTDVVRSLYNEAIEEVYGK